MGAMGQWDDPQDAADWTLYLGVNQARESAAHLEAVFEAQNRTYESVNVQRSFEATCVADNDTQIPLGSPQLARVTTETVPNVRQTVCACGCLEATNGGKYATQRCKWRHRKREQRKAKRPER